MFPYEPKIDTSSKACDPRNAWESFTSDFGHSIADLTTSGLGTLLLLLLLILVALRVVSLPIIADRNKSIAAVAMLAGTSASMLYFAMSLYKPDNTRILTVGLGVALAVAATLIGLRIVQAPRGPN